MEIVSEEKTEQALLIGVDDGTFDADVSMAELGELTKTAGAEVCAVMIQKRKSVESATFVGKGRLDEIAQFCKNSDVDVIIADSELSPVQVRNIEDFTDVRVIDRTMLILDIFASRARSSEGKLQVELAQLQYLLPRLTGKGASLSRLGGGIGTRGPGETKLESDRRHIRRRIQCVKNELEKVEKRRHQMHIRRQKNAVETVAVVGYTNVGKSTLMNRLTGAGVLEEDKLFATLDPTARKLTLNDGRQVMLVDTVGLIRRLPHELVDAFRSTLEEAVWADVILNVCDESSDECQNQIKVTNELLSSLGCGDKPVINVLNKCDLADDNKNFLLVPSCVRISALNGDGIENLLDAISKALPQDRKRVNLLLPFDKLKIVAKIRSDGVVHSETYTNSGLLLDATVTLDYLDEIKEYIF